MRGRNTHFSHMISSLGSAAEPRVGPSEGGLHQIIFGVYIIEFSGFKSYIIFSGSFMKKKHQPKCISQASTIGPTVGMYFKGVV